MSTYYLRALAPLGVIGSIVGVSAVVSNIGPSQGGGEQIPLFSEGVAQLVAPTLSQESTTLGSSLDSEVDSQQADLEHKEQIRQEAESALERIRDYSFRIFGPCGVGTGWVLDYQLPEPNEKYPTTGYIATNAHVISSFRFSENPYDQILPKSKEQTNSLRGSHRGIKHSHLSLGGDARTTCNSVDGYGYLDMNISQADTGAERKADFGAVESGKMEEPKLFGAAFNFLKKDANTGVDYDHFSDFAVLELKFKSQDEAKKATGNFAEKYATGKKTPLNVFAKSLEERYTREQIEKNTENFYTLAFPGKRGDKFGYSTNFDKVTAEAGKLEDGDDYWYRKDSKNPLKGFAIIQKGFKGADKEYKGIGHVYMLKNRPLGKGSSGGIFTDKDGNLTGVIALVEVGDNAKRTFLAPLRSKGLDESFAGIRTPKYDLILGGENQESSYRAQVEKFIIEKRKKNTWLSSLNGGSQLNVSK